MVLKNRVLLSGKTEKIVKVNVNVIVEQNGFLSLVQTEVFALDEIEFLKGIMVLGISLSGCSHTRKIITNSIKILWQE